MIAETARVAATEEAPMEEAAMAVAHVGDSAEAHAAATADARDPPGLAAAGSGAGPNPRDRPTD